MELRNIFFVLILIYNSTSVVFCQISSNITDLPNIILIVADDLGYSDLEPFDDSYVKTPSLQRLANEGIKATNFYVSSPACTPSRSSILTGRYPQRNGLYDMIRNDMVNYGHEFTELEYRRQPESTLGMDLKEKTIGDMMKKAGYKTGVIGKWDGGRAKRFLPLQRGFDYFFGIVNTGVDYWTHERYGIPSLFRNNELVIEEGFLIELEGDEVSNFIKENHGNPFFLYYPSFAPHMSSNLDKTGINPPQKYLEPYQKQDIPEKRKETLGTIMCLDDQIGRILDLLDQYDIADNTLIIFFSDNGGGGGSKNGIFKGGKASLWEGGIRSPFLARWPKVIPAGISSDKLFSSLDLMPTFATIAKTWVPDATMDGYDVLNIFKDSDNPSPRNEMFWEWMDQKAVRIGNYKWIEINGKQSVYDLKIDPKERDDISESEPALLDSLKNRWQLWREEMNNAEPRGPFRDF